MSRIYPSGNPTSLAFFYSRHRTLKLAIEIPATETIVYCILNKILFIKLHLVQNIAKMKGKVLYNTTTLNNTLVLDVYLLIVYWLKTFSFSFYL